MKKKNKTLLTGLLLSALAVPLAVNPSEAADRLVVTKGNSATVTEGSVFSDITSDSSGGAISNKGEIGSFTASFDGNTVGQTTKTAEGGAIYNINGAKIGDITADFTNNTASATSGQTLGGAIYNNYKSEIDNITGDFIGNKSISDSNYAQAGAIYNRDGSKIGNINGNFENNAAISGSTELDAYGGAIVNNGVGTEITSITGTFTGNSAQGKYWGQGGAILNIVGTIGDINADFIGNYSTGETAGADGGAILSGGTINSISGNFVGNYASATSERAMGGAIYNYGTVSSLSGNYENNYVENADGTNAHGGAIYNHANGNLTIADEKTTFTSNSAGNDGGAISNKGSLTIEESASATFTGNTAGSNGGAIYNDGTATLSDASFTNNSATGNGGAIYSNADVTINSVNEDVIFSGNSAADGGDIFMAKEGSNLNISAAADKTVTLASGVSGVAGAGGTSGFNTNVTGAGTLDVQSYINNTAMTINDTATLWLNEGSQLGAGTTVTMNDGTSLNTINNNIDSFADGVISMNGTVAISADINTATGQGDNFSNVATSAGTTIIVNEINSIGGSDVASGSVSIYDALGLRDVAADVNFAETQVSDITTAIRKYNGSINSDGMISYTPTGNSYNDFNSAVMVAPVAAQLGGYLTQLNTYNQAFDNMDMYKIARKEQQLAMKYGNKFAAADSDLVFDPINTPYSDKAGWFRPYTNIGSVGLKNGPKVDNVLYGTMVGLESEMYDLGKGWDGIFSLYAGYNGSHQKFQSNSIYQNGGSLGLVGMAYKGNFFTGLTANIGANIADADTKYGNEDFSMLMTGIASKSGYNWELADGKFIIQPNYTMSYSMINTFDYTNAAGVRIDSDPLHAIHIEPGVKFIGNLKNGWQPYAGVSVVMNLLDDTKFKANDVALPELSVKPYAKYGVGVRKTWGQKFTGFLQTFITSGGRNSVGLQGGFRWTLGKTKETTKANSTGERKVVKTRA